MEVSVRQNRMSVIVIGVNYKTDTMALRFVRSLLVTGKDIDITIVLVDNSEETDGTTLFDKVRSESQDVMCVKPPRNLGYFGGARLGLNEYLATGARLPDWVLVSNVDVRFGNCPFFDHLCNTVYGEDVGVVAPSICSESSQYDYNPYMVSRPSKLKVRFYTLLYRSVHVFTFYRLLSHMKSKLGQALTSKLNCNNKESKIIYAPYGALIIFSKTFFLRGGSLDYPAFLFNEELYIAEIARDVGAYVVYDPNLQVFHEEHTSTKWLDSHKSVSYRYDSAVFIAERYFS
jgi:GT2 family glycosyltransferase